ncbi:aspartate carbamoyltransferase [Candidatus Woesearchaeota archaeon]|nr:aspartate carbamoyltransferase [Candidatus Woesearchaeota archaeon]
MQNVISIRDFSRKDLDTLIGEVISIKNNGLPENISHVQGVKIASLFFEDSTRTRTSSETAARDLGMIVHGMAGPEGTSVKKGEPLLDTASMYIQYNDKLIIMRHNLEGSARFIADYYDIPVINGGDGTTSHPTQTMLDLVTIQEEFEHIDGLKIAMVGDLKYGRTVHSLLQACEIFDIEPWLVAPENIAMPEWRVQDYIDRTGKKPIITSDFMEAINTVDVLYMTRIQRERFPGGEDGEREYQKVSGVYNLTADMLRNARKEMIVMHPLPRYKHNMEISTDVDKTRHARYIQQAGNGLPTRQAIILRALGEEFEGREHNGSGNEDPWHDLEFVPKSEEKRRRDAYVLENGTQIDHIEQLKGLEVLRVLGMEDDENYTIVSAKNVPSGRHGKKDVLVFQGVELTPRQLSRLGLVSSTATINIISNGNVVKKGKVDLPYVLDNLVHCETTTCVGNPDNHEHAPTKFYTQSQDPLTIRCYYCETPVIGRENIRLLK